VEDILHVLDNMPTDGIPENRRSQKRLNVRLDTEVTLLASPVLPRAGIVTRNLSVRGLGFICYREFRKSDLIAIHLEVVGRVGRLLLGKVAFCRYVRAGVYEAGAEFEEVAKGECDKIPMAWMQRAQLSMVGVKKPSVKAAAT